jgi:hypothetical protein
MTIILKYNFVEDFESYNFICFVSWDAVESLTLRYPGPAEKNALFTKQQGSGLGIQYSNIPFTTERLSRVPS